VGDLVEPCAELVGTGSENYRTERDAVEASVGLYHRLAEFRFKRACAFGGRINERMVNFVAIEVQTTELFKIRTEK
jgi:hypothetical protein